MSKLNSRVYGVAGIKSKMSNWNADFNGMPKSISTGEVFGSDKAFKYPIKKMWQNEGDKILYVKSLKMDDTKKNEVKIRPRSLKERYEQIFDVQDLKKEKDMKQILRNLFTAEDVKNFGATFAEEGNNISITGAVQITQGFNKYDGHYVEEQQILSPFRNPKDDTNKDTGEAEEKDQSTLGTKIVSNEAHYLYGFAINPSVYKDFEDIGVTDGYTEQDYDKFKNGVLVAATAYNTNAKVGCENEFALFAETENDLYLPDLANYVTFEKSEKGEKDVIVLTELTELLSGVQDSIEKISIYYNPITTVLRDIPDKAVLYNIFTKEQIDGEQKK